MESNVTNYGAFVDYLKERELKFENTTSPKAKVITDLEDYSGKILKIHPNPWGYFRFSNRLRKSDSELLRITRDYLEESGASAIYAFGSSLWKADYNDIDLIAAVPDESTGAKIVYGLNNGKIEGTEVEDLTQIPYFVKGVQYRMKIKPKKKGAKPIDLTIVTESKLEEMIE